ncbi:Bli1p [Maudiozyma exigua]|uniref:Biogenesis of lysosome-related organelles complex 1 subunit BLI1 n=1 Tax=Maudiozyma exigua TaxID=34358 RepID=A0A9P6WDV7_MAUEX|nr:Bli1p [Kazachstania exigua]
MQEGGATEKANRRQLQKNIENCVNVLQEGVDIEAAEAISVFSNKTTSNEKWAATLNGTYKIKTEHEIEEFIVAKKDYIEKIDKLEQKVNYFERLCNEMEELGRELEIKTKVERSR